MLSRSFTKAELQINQLKHKQLPHQIDFEVLQNKTLKSVHYLMKHEKVLPRQKHDTHPILADFDSDQFSIRINDKCNNINLTPLNPLSFKSVFPFQIKFKTTLKKNKKHPSNIFFFQFFNNADSISIDEEHISTRIPKRNPNFTADNTLHDEIFSPLQNRSLLLHQNRLLL